MSTVSCEMPDRNPPGEEIRKILMESKTIAIVGLSDNRERDSNIVARYLIDRGYTVIPVNPAKTEILGRKCYPDLKSIPGAVDIVDVFRNIEAVPEIVNEALLIKPRAIWLQLGLAHKISAEKSRDEGIIFIQSKCIKIEHGKLVS